QDQTLIDYLKNKQCSLEIALHGWDHQNNPPEFAEISEEEAYLRLTQGKNVLEEIFDDSIITFIPPHNQYSPEAKKALENTGFKVVSSEGDRQFDYTVSTFDSEKDRLNLVSEVIKECQAGLEENNLCVVMLHPQDYATDLKLDKSKYQSYLKLLDELKGLEVSLTTFSNITEDE
ncbi:DUF2334 domain-containing protein, partial [Patescibacteria group bacterium]